MSKKITAVTTNLAAGAVAAPPAAPRIPVEYVTAKEAAEYTGLALPTLNAMRAVGLGPKFVRISPRRIVYEIAALREYMDARTITPSVA